MIFNLLKIVNKYKAQIVELLDKRAIEHDVSPKFFSLLS